MKGSVFGHSDNQQGLEKVGWCSFHKDVEHKTQYETLNQKIYTIKSVTHVLHSHSRKVHFFRLEEVENFCAKPTKTCSGCHVQYWPCTACRKAWKVKKREILLLRLYR